MRATAACVLTLRYREVVVSTLALVLCPWLRFEEYFCMRYVRVLVTHYKRSLVSVINMVACLSGCWIYKVPCVGYLKI